MTTVDSLLTNALRDRYVVERELGRGGMATVYLARDVKHDRAVALKVLHSELAATVGSERFLREIRIAASFAHPHILPLHDSGQASGFLYFVMPFVEGESLRARLRRERQLAPDEAVRITRDVADALNYAHQHGIVHRDVKPENVLFEAGHAVLSDFGVARAINIAAGDQLTETGLAIGSPSYMSPEQVLSEREIDGRADVYALGCLLYEMLAGTPPFQGDTVQVILRQHLAALPRALSSLRPDLPQEMSRAVAKALAKAPEDRWATAVQFAAALGGEFPAGSFVSRLRSARWVHVVSAGLALVVATGLLLTRSGTRADFDPQLIAIAPFGVLGPELELWREGLADVLVANLDGTGPLRTVPSTVVMRQWAGRADPAAAADLGRRTRARVVVLGHLAAAGSDSVRARVTLVDAAARAPIADFEVRDLAARMDRLADTLTVGILRDLSANYPIGAYRIRLAGLGTTSLPALKAFLRAEQFYRRAADDSAVPYYERATQLDPTFAVAFRHLGWARWGRRAPGDIDSLMLQDWVRAGALNRGLPPRESLLVAIDSLQGALGLLLQRAWPPWQLITRYVAMAEEGAKRYPNDPEAWYVLGEARLHWGTFVGVTLDETLEAFDRAIALDSAFATAYYHGIQLALELDNDSAARRYAEGYLSQRPSGGDAVDIRLAKHILDASQLRPEGLERLADTVALEPGLSAANILLPWADSAETIIRLTRRLAARASSDSTGFAAQSRITLAAALAYRGHLREAYRAVGSGRDYPMLLADLAWLGAIPDDSLHAITAGFLADGWWGALSWLIPAWAARGDTGVLIRITSSVDSVAEAAKGTAAGEGSRQRGEVGRAYLALARGDTSEALTRFIALPDSIFSGSNLHGLTKAGLLAAQEDLQDAAAILKHVPPFFATPLPSTIVWTSERAEIQERLGKREEALAAFRRVIRVWQHSDPDLQPFVAEARQASARLSAELGR